MVKRGRKRHRPKKSEAKNIEGEECVQFQAIEKPNLDILARASGAANAAESNGDDEYEDDDNAQFDLEREFEEEKRRKSFLPEVSKRELEKKKLLEETRRLRNPFRIPPSKKQINNTNAAKHGIEETNLEPAVCDVCGLEFNHRSSLSRHIGSFHPALRQQNATARNGNIVCLEDNCFFKGRTIGDLRGHLQKEHGMQFTLIERNFESWDNFLGWKNSIENWLNINFVEPRGAQETLQHEVKNYICNRSGRFRATGTGQRRSKSTGSVKIGHYCTASMRAKRDKMFGDVRVEAYVEHYGHEVSLEHLRVPKLERERIVGKIKMGVPLERLLKDTTGRKEAALPEVAEDVMDLFEMEGNEEEGIGHNKLIRLFLINQRFLLNLEKSYGIKALRLSPASTRGRHKIKGKGGSASPSTKILEREMENEGPFTEEDYILEEEGIMRGDKGIKTEVGEEDPEEEKRERGKESLYSMIGLLDKVPNCSLTAALELVEQAKEYLESLINPQQQDL